MGGAGAPGYDRRPLDFVLRRRSFRTLKQRGNWSLGRALRLSYLQVVLYAENTGHGIGADVRGVFVSLIVHPSFKRYVAVIYNDVNRLDRVPGIFLQTWQRIDGMEFRFSNLLVHRR